MLYSLLKHIVESNNELPLKDKNFEAENMTKKKNNDGFNTKKKMYKTISTQTEKLMDTFNNLSNDLSINNNTDIVNKFNLPSSSYDTKSKISESTILNISNNLNSLLTSSNSSDISMEVNYEYDHITKFSNNLNEGNDSTNNILSIDALLKVLQDSPEHDQQLLKLDEHSRSLDLAIENENRTSTDNLSELRVPIYIDPNVIRTHKIHEILKDKYKSKRVAKSYEMKKHYKQLSQELQIRLNQKYNDLFGDDHDYESDPLSEEEEHIIAHKRIVRMVVCFMTPYYRENRINRHLFKTLAKLISKNLMERAYDPGKFCY